MKALPDISALSSREMACLVRGLEKSAELKLDPKNCERLGRIIARIVDAQDGRDTADGDDVPLADWLSAKRDHSEEDLEWFAATLSDALVRHADSAQKAAMIQALSEMFQ